MTTHRRSPKELDPLDAAEISAGAAIVDEATEAITKDLFFVSADMI
jgi:hypothetical protein